MIKLLIKIGFLYHKSAFDSLIELFRSDPRYSIRYALDEERMRKFLLFNVKHRPRLLDELEAEGYAFTDETSGFDVVLTGDTIRNSDDYGDAMLCFLNHGTGIKNILYRNLAKNQETRYEIFVEGQYRVDRLNRSGALGKSEVHLVGLPKLDHYFQGRFDDREGLLNSLGLDPDKKTVLFAPTYKPTCMYEVEDAIFDATRKDYNLIIKLHHYSWMGKYAPHRQHRIFEERVPRNPHSVLIPMESYNIVPYMAAADTLLSEASSTVFDFLALGKTGIIYDLPCDDLKHSDGQALLEEDNREFLKDSFAHVQSPDQLREGIERALNPTPDMIAAARREREYRFHRLDGRAGERVKETIEQRLPSRVG